MAEQTERGPGFRQRAVATANLLLEAASILETPRSNDAMNTDGGSSANSLRTRLSLRDRGSGSRPTATGFRLRTRSLGSGSTHSGSHPTQDPGSLNLGAFRSSSSCRIRRSDDRARSPSADRGNADTELRSLFNWTTASKGRGGKRKGSHRSAGGPFRKKAKVVTWTHSWVCLSTTSDDTIPDASDRVTLKLAGLGEKRFTLDCCATAQELYDVLEYQFPKLKDGGGFELLRTGEGGSRELEVVRMPAGGYTTEYLKAVIHNAKLYIRPLQSDLSVEQCSSGSDVS